MYIIYFPYRSAPLTRCDWSCSQASTSFCHDDVGENVAVDCKVVLAMKRPVQGNTKRVVGFIFYKHVDRKCQYNNWVAGCVDFAGNE